MGIEAYKDSEVGKIPRDWSVKQIGKIGYTYSGLTGKGKNDFGKGNSRYITFLNVLNNPVLRTDIFERVSVSDGEHQNLALKGDLFFNTSSETPEEVGICALLDDDVPNLYLNSFCFGYRLTDPEVDGLFLSYFFRSKAGRDIMTMLAQGATRYNLSKESFNKTLIAFPPFEEQKKIAEALSCVDDMIGALDEAIAKKRQIKEGLMQQLLTGNIRLPGFSGEWRDAELKEFGYMIRGVSYKPEDSSLKPEDGYVRLLRSNNIQEGKMVYSDYVYVKNANVADYQYMKDGDILICMANGSKQLVGKTARLTRSGVYTFGAFMGVFRCNDKTVCPFVGELLKTGYYRKLLDDILTGSAINNLNGAAVESLKFFVPSDSQEQRAIAEVLCKADDEINGLECQRDKYRLIKQGMMQELLTGKTRL